MEDSFLTNRFLPLSHSVYFEELMMASNNPPPGSNYLVREDNSFIVTQTPDFILVP